MPKRMLLLATVLAVVLSAAATALASSRNANDSTKGSSGNNKDFSGLVDIGGGHKIYMECSGKGSPTVVLISGKGNGARDGWAMHELEALQARRTGDAAPLARLDVDGLAGS